MIWGNSKLFLPQFHLAKIKFHRMSVWDKFLELNKVLIRTTNLQQQLFRVTLSCHNTLESKAITFQSLQNPKIT